MCLSHTKLLYWSGSMSEAQQGPEICHVISAKRYSLLVVYSLKPVPSNVVSAEAEYI